MMTSLQVANELGVPYSTIMLWLKQGRFAGAERDDTNPRGPVWNIPRSALAGFSLPTRGRPGKAKAETEASKPTAKKKSSKASSAPGN